MEDYMKSLNVAKSMTAFAVLAALAGCSTCDSMDKTEGTVGAGAGDAVPGRVDPGPVDAVVGGVGGRVAADEGDRKVGGRLLGGTGGSSGTAHAGMLHRCQRALDVAAVVPRLLQNQVGQFPGVNSV